MEKVISGSDTLTIFKLSKVCVERMLACKLPTVHSVRKLQILFWVWKHLNIFTTYAWFIFLELKLGEEENVSLVLALVTNFGPFIAALLQKYHKTKTTKNTST